MSAYGYGGSPSGFTPSSPTGGSSEKSVKSCYAVVYELDNKKWVVSGEGGWSEVHLCMDSADNTHRILAWTVKNQNVLMNCNVTGECAHKEKSKNFHSFSDENGSRFGLGFHKSESGLKQAQQFYDAVLTVISLHRNVNSSNVLSSNPPPTMSSNAPPTMSSSMVNGNNYNNNANVNANANNNYNKPQPPQPMPPPNPFQNNNNNYDNINNNSNSKPMPPQPPPTMSSTVSSQGNQSSDYSQKPLPNTPPPVPQSTQQQNNQHKPPPPPGPSKQTNSMPPPTMSAMSDNNNTNYSNNNGNNYNSGGMPSYNNDNGYNNSYNNQNQNNGYQSQNSSGLPQATQPLKYSDDNSGAQMNQVRPKKKSIGNINELPTYHLNTKQKQSLPAQPISTNLGGLNILPPKPGKLNSGDASIENPDSVEHVQRVVHDKETGQFIYKDLPQEWIDVLNKQFGVAPKLLPSVKLAGYEHKIPKVLISLRNKLEQANAYNNVGIFRLAPNAMDNDKFKASIDKGKFEVEEKVDSNVYANLIKVWFRDLPDPLLNCVNSDLIEIAQTESDVAGVMAKFPEPQKSIFLWLCDMCVECARYEKVNKMTAQNLAIVIGPNLFNTDDFENPMKAMTFSGKVVQFFKLAIEMRQKMAR